MCLDCGCHRWGDSHGDPHHLTRASLNDVLLANSSSPLTKEQMAANIKEGVDAWVANDPPRDTNSTKSVTPEPHMHQGDGFRYSIQIEPSE